jgi:DNA-binding transcriptional ArsR family regulator
MHEPTIMASQLEAYASGICLGSWPHSCRWFNGTSPTAGAAQAPGTIRRVKHDQRHEGRRMSSKDGGKPAPRVGEQVAEQVADAMFALSTPSRVQILGCLLDGPHAVTELMDKLGMEQSTVSHQLRVLREHTLVKAERVGRRRVYALHDEHVTAFLEDALRHVEHRSAATGSRGSATPLAPSGCHLSRR